MGSEFNTDGHTKPSKVVADKPPMEEDSCALSQVLKESVGEPDGETEKTEDKDEEKKAEDTVVVEEEIVSVDEDPAFWTKAAMVYGEDDRYGYLPKNCSIRCVRDTAMRNYPGLKGVLIKHKNFEGDLVTITTNNELMDYENSIMYDSYPMFYITEVDCPDDEPLYEGTDFEEESCEESWEENGSVTDDERGYSSSTCLDNFVQFSKMSKNPVDLKSVSHLDLIEIELKCYVEKMEAAVTSEDYQRLFDLVTGRCNEVTAIAQFNLGNAHLSRARKLSYPPDPEEGPFGHHHYREASAAYKKAHQEYTLAGASYEEALKAKPNFPEAQFALGIQKFELTKLMWSYGTCRLNNVLDEYDKVDDDIYKATKMLEEIHELPWDWEDQKPKMKEEKKMLRNYGLQGLLRDVASEEARDEIRYMERQMSFLWGMIMYERSFVEFELEMPDWERTLGDAFDKLRFAGILLGDFCCLYRNHCSCHTASKVFTVDEIVKNWSERDNHLKGHTGLFASRLKPFFIWHTPKRIV